VSREVWRYPVARGAVDPLLEPRLDEVMHTGELPLVGHPSPRHARQQHERTPVMSDKTRRTVRTVLQVVLGLALAVPVLLEATGLRGDEWPWLAFVVAGAAVVARLMQSPAADELLHRVGLGGIATAPVPRIVEGEASIVDDHEDAPPGA